MSVSSARRPVSVIRTLVTSTGLPPAKTRSGVAVTSLSRTKRYMRSRSRAPPIAHRSRCPRSRPASPTGGVHLESSDSTGLCSTVSTRPHLLHRYMINSGKGPSLGTARTRRICAWQYPHDCSDCWSIIPCPPGSHSDSDQLLAGETTISSVCLPNLTLGIDVNAQKFRNRIPDRLVCEGRCPSLAAWALVGSPNGVTDSLPLGCRF